MTLKNNRAPLLCYFKLCASFRSHQWIQTGVTVQNRPIWVKICDLLTLVTLKFHGWPWKTIRHILYATSSFAHHFVAISGFKLELQSGNAQFGSKSMIFLAVWPWNTGSGGIDISVVKSTSEMLTVRGQQHSFSTPERMFLWKYRCFWDRNCLELRGTRNPQPSDSCRMLWYKEASH